MTVLSRSPGRTDRTVLGHGPNGWHSAGRPGCVAARARGHAPPGVRASNLPSCQLGTRRNLASWQPGLRARARRCCRGNLNAAPGPHTDPMTVGPSESGAAAAADSVN
eukprot:9594-Hanusia_phi.AAC.1